MAKNPKAGVHFATITEFNGINGKAYVKKLNRHIKIHLHRCNVVKGSWITDEKHMLPSKSDVKVGLEIVLLIGYHSNARIWGLAKYYVEPPPKRQQPPWQLTPNCPQPTYA